MSNSSHCILPRRAAMGSRTSLSRKVKSWTTLMFGQWWFCDVYFTTYQLQTHRYYNDQHVKDHIIYFNDVVDDYGDTMPGWIDDKGRRHKIFTNWWFKGACLFSCQFQEIALDRRTASMMALLSAVMARWGEFWNSVLTWIMFSDQMINCDNF